MGFKKILVVLVLMLIFAYVGVAYGANAQENIVKRDGATLYRQNCARCHSERYPTERTDGQWKTIMLHMQTRGQIPAADAREILEYLQQSN